MTRALTLGSVVYQSAAAIMLIVCVSRLVPAEAYTAISLVMASAQCAGLLACEWAHMAAYRYLSSASPEEAPRLRVCLFLAEAVGAALLAVAALALLALLHAVPAAAQRVPDASLVLLGLGIALGQAVTDLTVTMVRVSGRVARAAWLLLLRASVLLLCTVAGAWFDGSARGVLAGNLLGHAASLALALATHPDLLRGAPWRLDRTELARFARFGMPTAAASLTHLTVPVAIRYLVVGWHADNAVVSAALSLALDLLQRPFSVLSAAIHIVSYPEVVAAHDRGGGVQARAATSRLLEFMLCATVILLGGLVCFLPEAALLLVKAEWRPDFVQVGGAAIGFFFLHSQLQMTLAVVPQLREATARLVGVAAAQFVAVAGLVAAGMALGASPRDALALAAVGTALVALYAVRPTLAFGAFPASRLTASAVAGAGLIAATALHADPGPVWLAVRITLSAAVVGGIAWSGDFLHLRRAGPATSSRPAGPAVNGDASGAPRRRAQPAVRGAARMSRSRRAERSQA